MKLDAVLTVRLALPCVLALALLASLCGSGSLLAGDKDTWSPISHELTAKIEPGYPGKTAGVTVDPASGDVYMVVPDRGIWRSSDHGKSFARVDDDKLGGRCETGFSLDFDPHGKRLACFMIYGPSALASDGGTAWSPIKTSHFDFGAVDWESGGKCLLALRHESGGQLCFSSDGAQSWTNLDKGVTALGLFDEHALVISKGKGLLLSEDQGKTWTPVSDVDPAGRVMRVYKGVGYWTTDRGLLVSRDRGRSWAIEGAEVSAVFGPYWGTSSEHMVVVGKQGIQETLDGGKIWKVVAPLPPDGSVGMVGPTYAWDARANIFYASTMGKDTLKFEPGAAER